MKSTATKATCSYCKRKVLVRVPGCAATPYFAKHSVGKSADRKGGETPRTTCIGSWAAAPKEVTEV